MIRYMTHLLCSKYLGNFFLALSLVLFSHKISATSWAYTETLVSLDNEFARDTVYLEYDGFIDHALEQLGQIKAAQVSLTKLKSLVGDIFPNFISFLPLAICVMIVGITALLLCLGP